MENDSISLGPYTPHNVQTANLMPERVVILTATQIPLTTPPHLTSFVDTRLLLTATQIPLTPPHLTSTPPNPLTAPPHLTSFVDNRLLLTATQIPLATPPHLIC
ncbi:hypothetical protein O6H91_12G020600 [Diphasiastrum complanatum]|uniref:Uncharacterized protein n=1 Tax=Diphasiastrum complanatum TaxID=34168 RepID=A0ACC2BZU4_DIPCM|nr:hypothetical protein O6H91_12G020600 [Diphasiastrum complanatum]